MLLAPSFEYGSGSVSEGGRGKSVSGYRYVEAIGISTKQILGQSLAACIHSVPKPKPTKPSAPDIPECLNGRTLDVPWSIDCPQTFLVRAFPFAGKSDWNRGLQIEDTSKNDATG